MSQVKEVMDITEGSQGGVARSVELAGMGCEMRGCQGRDVSNRGWVRIVGTTPY